MDLGINGLELPSRIDRKTIEDKLSKTVFLSIENFIAGYNSGVLARKSEKVIKVLEEILQACPEIEHKGLILVKKSDSEIKIKDSLELLEAWLGLLRLKRDIEFYVEKEELDVEEFYLHYGDKGTEILIKEFEYQEGEELEDGSYSDGLWVAVESRRVGGFYKKDVYEIAEKYLSKERDSDGDLKVDLNKIYSINADFIHGIEIPKLSLA